MLNFYMCRRQSKIETNTGSIQNLIILRYN